MTTNKPEVLAYATHHDEPMLFPSRKEAAAYCEDGEEPVALICLSDYEALQAECEKLRKDAGRYRWLRDNCEMTADEYGTAGQLYFGTYQSGRLDEAIDAAIQEYNPCQT